MSDIAAPRAGRREWIGLAVLALPTMLLSLDLSVLFLALPHLSADLGASSTEQLWISDIYGFMTAGFLITMGSVGDRVGRRKLLLMGATAFGVISAVAAYSQNPEMLIVARGLLGIVGATLLPSTLALIRNMFHDPKQMGVAFAGWTTAYMAGIALGPVVGGIMLNNFWWGSVFLLGVPVMLVLLIAGPLLLPEHRDPSAAGRIDLLSVVLSLVAILPFIYGLKRLASAGFTVLPLISIVVGLAFGVVFVVRQRRLDDPLLDLRLFGIRTVCSTVIMAVLIAALQNGNTLIVTLFLQMVRGFSPLRAGLWLVLPAVALIVTINAAPHLARRFRPGYVYASGLLVSAVGYLLLTQVTRGEGLALLVIGIVVVNAGIGPAGALTNQLVLGAAPPERAGSAASLTSTGGEFGIALGIATLGSISTAVFRSDLNVPAGVPADQVNTAHQSIVGAVQVAGHVPGAAGGQLLNAARDAFTTTLNTTAGISAGLFVLVAIIAAVILGHEGRTGEAPATEDASAETVASGSSTPAPAEADAEHG